MKNKFLAIWLLVTAGVAALGICIGAAALAQGSQRLPTFGSGAQIAVQSCTTSCFVTASSGTFTATAATAVVITDANITTNSVVMFGLKTIGGTPAGAPFMSAITPGTGFSVKSFAGDTSVYNYVILN